MKYKKTWLGLGLVGLVSIISLPISITIFYANSKNEVNYRRDFIAGNAWYTGSAEMKAMARTQYKAAEAMFDDLKEQDGFQTDKVDAATGAVSNTDADKAIPVVFMDIDETVLSNISYQNYNIINNKTYSPKTWENWITSEQATEIDGTIDFIEHVWEGGGVVMFNSDRPQSFRQSTKNNLIKEGLDEQYLNDWVFWMKGIDPTEEKPWTIDDNDWVHKEIRMTTMNDTAGGYDLSAYTDSGDKVALKTIMRIGDNLDDFNDNASKHKLNTERTKIYEGHISDNFGSTETPGKKYDAKTDTWTDAEWNEGYVLLGGNSAYGGWEAGLETDYFDLTPEEQAKIRLESLEAIPVWDGTAAWDGK